MDFNVAEHWQNVLIERKVCHVYNDQRDKETNRPMNFLDLEYIRKHAVCNLGRRLYVYTKENMLAMVKRQFSLDLELRNYFVKEYCRIKIALYGQHFSGSQSDEEENIEPNYMDEEKESIDPTENCFVVSCEFSYFYCFMIFY